MRRQKGQHAEPDVPVSSFSDIAFLLIIFFILATTLTQLRGFYTEIPAGDKSDAPSDKTNVVNLYDGNISLNDEQLSLEQLAQKLTDMGLRDKSDNDKVILLETSGEVNYQLYYRVMTMITNAGGAIAMVDPESEE